MSRRNIIVLVVVAVLALAAVGVSVTALVTHDGQPRNGGQALSGSQGSGSQSDGAEGYGWQGGDSDRDMFGMHGYESHGGSWAWLVVWPIVGVVVLVCGGLALFFGLRRRGGPPAAPAAAVAGMPEAPSWLDEWHRAAHATGVPGEAQAAEDASTTEAVSAEAAVTGETSDAPSSSTVPGTDEGATA